MTPDEVLKNSGNQKFEVNVGVSLLRIIEITNRNQEYLREILKQQLILKETLINNSEIPEGLKDKLFDLETKIWKVAEEKYHILHNGILDNNQV